MAILKAIDLPTGDVANFWILDSFFIKPKEFIQSVTVDENGSEVVNKSVTARIRVGMALYSDAAAATANKKPHYVKEFLFQIEPGSLIAMSGAQILSALEHMCLNMPDFAGGEWVSST